MSEIIPTPPTKEDAGPIGRKVRRSLAVVSAGTEFLISRRGLQILFMIGGMVLAVAGWLRPPLSPDIRAIYIPLGLCNTAGSAPEEILYGPRRLGLDRLGVLLLGLLGAGLGVALWRPQRFDTVLGAVLCAAIAANAAVCCNHPGLIELIDIELEQRQQIVEIENSRTLAERSMAVYDNGRIDLLALPSADEQRGDLERGWMYMVYGWWLIPWTIAGILLTGRGSLPRRLAHIGRWAFLGIFLACAVCNRRLCAEHDWNQARRLEGQCDYAAAQKALSRAVALFPEFERMERTWLLAGKLDYCQKRSTPESRFFLAYQLARDKNRPRAIAYREDLPWWIKRRPDFREGLTTAPATLYPTLLNGGVNGDVTGQGYIDPSEPQLAVPLLEVNHETEELPGAAALMEGLLADENPNPALQHQAARLWTMVGLDAHGRSMVSKNVEPVNFEESRGLAAARDAWVRASRLRPASTARNFSWAWYPPARTTTAWAWRRRNLGRSWIRPIKPFAPTSCPSLATLVSRPAK